MAFNVDLYLETLKKRNGTYNSSVVNDANNSPIVNNASSTYKKGNAGQNTLGTFAELSKNFIGGFLLDPLEGLVDFGASIIGNIGGLFGANDFKKDVENFIKHDYSEDIWDYGLKYADPFSLVGMAIDGDWSANNDIADYSAVQYLPEFGQQLVTGVERGLGQVTGMLATGGIGGVGSKVGKTLANAHILSSATGGGIEQSLNEGNDLFKATGYGIISGATELAVEHLFGASLEKVFGKSIGDKAINKIIGVFSKGNSKASTIAKGFMKIGLESIGEGTEELLSDIIDETVTRPLLQMQTNGLDPSQLGADFLVGFLTSAITMGVSGNTYVRSNQSIETQEKLDAIQKKATQAYNESVNWLNEAMNATNAEEFANISDKYKTTRDSLFNDIDTLSRVDISSNTSTNENVDGNIEQGVNNVEDIETAFNNDTLNKINQDVQNERTNESIIFNFVYQNTTNSLDAYNLFKFITAEQGSIDEQRYLNELPENLREKAVAFAYSNNQANNVASDVNNVSDTNNALTNVSLTEEMNSGVNEQQSDNNYYKSVDFSIIKTDKNGKIIITEKEKPLENKARECLDKAEKNFDEIKNNIFDEVAEKYNLSLDIGFNNPSIKSVQSFLERLYRNIRDKNDGDPEKLKDWIRGTFIIDVDNINSIKEIVSQYGEYLKIIDIKKKSDYRGIHLNLVVNDIPVEIQLHTKESWGLKLQGDKFYEKYRNLDMKNLSLEEHKEYLREKERFTEAWNHLEEDKLFSALIAALSEENVSTSSLFGSKNHIGTFVNGSTQDSLEYSSTINPFSLEEENFNNRPRDVKTNSTTNNSSLDNNSIAQNQKENVEENKNSAILSEVTAVISPYYFNPVTEETAKVERAKVSEKFLNNAKEFANTFEMEIDGTIDTLGGYDYTDGRHVDEISFNFGFHNVSSEQVKKFTLVTADLGHEVQDTSYYYLYVDENSEDYNAVEYEISVKSTKGVLKSLNDLGITKYTIDEDNKTIKLTDFDDYDNPNSPYIESVGNLMKGLGDNYCGFKSRKVKSEYVVKRSRPMVYKKWIADIRARLAEKQGDSRVLQKQLRTLEQALEVVTESIKNDDLKEQEKNKNSGNKVLLDATPNVSVKDTIEYNNRYYTLSQRYNNLSYYTKTDANQFVKNTHELVEKAIGDNSNIVFKYDKDEVSAKIIYRRNINAKSIYEQIKQESKGKNLHLEGSEIDKFSNELADEIMESTSVLYNTDDGEKKATLTLKQLLTDEAYNDIRNEIKSSLTDLLTNKSKTNGNVHDLLKAIEHLRSSLMTEKGKRKALKEKATSLIQLERELTSTKNLIKFNNESSKVGRSMPNHFEVAFDILFKDLGRIVSSTKLTIREKGTEKHPELGKNIRGRLKTYRDTFYNQENFNKVGLSFNEEIAEALDNIIDPKNEGIDLSSDEIIAFRDILRNLKHLYTTSNNVTIDGKKIATEELAKQTMSRNEALLGTKKTYGSTQKRKNIFSRVLHKLMQWSISPDAVISQFDLGVSNGTLHKLITERIMEGERRANTMLKEMVDFKNKNFSKEELKRMAKDIEIEIGGKKYKMDVGTALEIHAELQRDWAMEHYKTTKSMEYYYDKVSHRIDGYDENICKNIEKVLGEDYTKKMSKALRDFYKIPRTYKMEVDESIFGYSNALNEDENYYPIRTTESSRMNDVAGGNINQMIQNMVRGFGFNKRTISTKGVLKVGHCFDTIQNYITNMYRYVAYADALDNVNRYLNYNMGNTTNPQYVWDMYVKNVDSEFMTYLKEYFMNVQGIYPHKSHDGLTRWLSTIRSNFSKAALFANPKVAIQQTSSIPMFLPFVSGKNLIKAMGSTVVHFKRSSKQMIDNSPMAFQRYQGNNVVDAQTLATDDSKRTAFGKIIDKTGAMITYMDMVACTIGYQACLLECNGDTNKATILFEQALRETQPSTTVSNASAFRRGAVGGEIGKTFAMFTSQTQQNSSIMVKTVAEYYTAKQMLKLFNNTNTEGQRLKLEEQLGMTKTECEQRLKQASKKLKRSYTALATQATIITLISMAIKSMLNDDDDDKTIEERVQEFALGMFDNTIGSLNPVFSAVSNMMSGYEFNLNTIDALNDFVSATRELGTYLSDIISGKEVNHMARLSSILRGMSYALGLPINNVTKYTNWVISWFSPETAVKMNNVLYGVSSTSSAKQLNEYMEKGKDNLAKTELSYLMANYKTGSISDSTRDELYRLYKEGYNVLPSSITKTITIDEVDYDMTNANRKRKFMSVYSGANPAVEKILNSSLYKQLSDDSKAYVLRKIYDTFYNLGKNAIADGGYAPDGKFNAIARVIGTSKSGYEQIATLAMYLAKINEIEGKTSDERKKKVEKYINSLSLSKEMKYLLYCVVGYAIPKSQKVSVTKYLKNKGFDSDTIDYLIG